MLLNVYKLARTTNKFVYLNMLESKVNHEPKQTPLQSCIPGETKKKRQFQFKKQLSFFINLYSQKNVNVYSSFIHNCPNLEATNMSFSR